MILGSAVNNDGARKVGFTAPRSVGQARVIQSAYVRAGVDPATITFLEAHGTGTPMGDPIEVAALSKVFRAHTSRRNFCALGSVKTNVGHLNTAAGIAGLIKTILSLEHRTIPPNLHFTRPLPALELEASPFHVPTAPTPWVANGGPLRAGVSSFGIGGTNAHVVLEEAPAAPPSRPLFGWGLLTLSARTPTALAAASEALAVHFDRLPESDIEDAGYTLQVGRRPLPCRRAVIAQSAAGAAASLRESATGQTATVEGRAVFLFPGQGVQKAGRGSELYRTEATFREWIDRSADILALPLGLDLRHLLLAPPDRRDEAEEALDRTAVTQAALFAFEYALAQVWLSWGLRPRALLGHSVGEYVAACLAEVMTLEEALHLLAARGRLMQSLPAGAMLAIPLSEGDVRLESAPELSLAAVNGPRQCVLSGPLSAVEGLAADLKAAGIETRLLRTSHAFHSKMMDPILEPFLSEVAAVRLRPPKIPYLSNLTGRWTTEEEATNPESWVRHLRETVRFGSGLQLLLEGPPTVLLEVGPGRSLSNLARKQLKPTSGHSIVPSLPDAAGTPEVGLLLSALGQVWSAGAEPDWARFHARQPRRRLHLPTYPFDRQRYWIEQRGLFGSLAEPALAEPEGTAFWVPSWRRTVAPTAQPSGHPWLLVTDRLGVGEELARRLRAMGIQVTSVHPDQLSASQPGVQPSDPAEGRVLADLLADLAASGSLPSTLVDFSTLAPAEGSAAVARSGFDFLVAGARALGGLTFDYPMRLAVVSSGLHEVNGDESLEPDKSLLLGPIHVVPKEDPRLDCRSIDVELPTGPEGRGRLVAQLLSEIASDASDRVVAYRGRYRWVPEAEPLELAAPPDGVALRPQGSYLITGGFGGIGLVLAEHLARTASARLTLVGRSLPGENDPRRERLREIEALGGRVLALAADVTCRDDIRRTIAMAREQFGPLHGVIHAAGVAGGGLIQRRSKEDFEAVLAPKVQGTRELAAALAPAELDFLLLCSSNLALAGVAGRADYCAANSFLDAFARAASRSGARVISVNWDGWSGVGMAAQPRPAPPTTAHPLLGDPASATADEIAYSMLLGTDHWVLAEHRLFGAGLAPGTAFLEMMAAAGRIWTGGSPLAIAEVEFLSALMVSDGQKREVRTVLNRQGDQFAVRVSSRPAPGEGGAQDWQTHATSILHRDVSWEPGRLALAELRQRLRPLPSPGAVLSGSAFVWGSRWQSVRAIWEGEGEVLAELELPPEFAEDLATFCLHPALLDVATSVGLTRSADGPLVPAGYRRLRVADRLPGKFYSHWRLLPGRGDGLVRSDVTLADGSGRELVRVEGFTLRPAPWGATAESAARAASPPATRRADGLEPSAACAAFDRIIARPGLPQVIVARRRSAVRSPIAGRGESDAQGGKRASRPAAARSLHPRPALSTSYVVPRTDTERKLAEIWQQLLGTAQVGVHDNFFELGGDSVIAIQLFARAADAGLKLSTGQILEQQTVAALAVAADRASAGPEAPAQLTPASTLPAPELPTGVEDSYPLSPTQEGMLFHSLYDPDSGVYLDQLSCVLATEGELEPSFLEKTFSWVVGRHPALRTAFVSVPGGRPLQRVDSRVEIPCQRLDWSNLDAAEQETLWRDFRRRDRARGFDLTRAPLLRVTLLRLAAGRSRFLLTYHHILLDAWSIFLVLKEVFDGYEAFQAGREPRELGCPRPYHDYIDWLLSQDLTASEGFWRRQLAGYSAPTDLSLAGPGDAPTDDERAVGARLGRAATLALLDFARRRHLTANTLIQAAWALLLSRYSGDEDLVFGTAVSGRPATLAGVESMVGLFINTLPVRLVVPARETLAPWLDEVQTRLFELLRHEHSPLSSIQGWSEIPRGTPLFESLVVFENVPIDEGLRQSSRHGVRIEGVAYAPRTNYPLTLLAAPGENLSTEILFDPRRCDHTSARRLLGHLSNLLRALPAAEARALSDLPFLDDAERHQLAVEWNDGDAPAPAECLHRVVSRQAERTPDAPAVVSRGATLSYGELEARANQLAGALRDRGVGTESRVALAVDRGLEMVVALLAILKTGGAYLPLDPSYPPERLLTICADASPDLLVSTVDLAARLGLDSPCLLLDRKSSEVQSRSRALVDGDADPDHLAYVLYTSGSTGGPKGVQVPHRALVNFLFSMRNRPGFDAGDRLVAVTSLAFDIAGLGLPAPGGRGMHRHRRGQGSPRSHPPRTDSLRNVCYPPPGDALYLASAHRIWLAAAGRSAYALRRRSPSARARHPSASGGGIAVEPIWAYRDDHLVRDPPCGTRGPARSHWPTDRRHRPSRR